MDYRALFLVPLAALVLSVSAAAPRMPDDWHVETIVHRMQGPGVGPKHEVGIDPASDASGVPTLHLRLTRTDQVPAVPVDVGDVWQQASGYGGQRVRFSAEVRAAGASRWAGLYMTAKSANMVIRAAQGAPGVEQHLPPGAAVTPGNDWQPVSVVMDVPKQAPSVWMGMALVGQGEVWMRKLSFDVVGPEVPVTTTPIGIDWEGARKNMEQTQQMMAKFPPQALANAQLD
ncbi:hypothetical protein [Roseateles paludis]|jgi:hypothetical protein|uniref:Uncharacterized protein n=1 Tax=Roseateles paludis TaxID=3145238 RepID=A0ABV0G7L5_9BURK